MLEVRLIDANELHAIIIEENRSNYAAAENVAQILLRSGAVLTIEAEPVRHGRWIKQENGLNLCSVCGVTKVSHLPFCGHCGAKMDACNIADNSKKVGGVENA